MEPVEKMPIVMCQTTESLALAHNSTKEILIRGATTNVIPTTIVLITLHVSNSAVKIPVSEHAELALTVKLKTINQFAVARVVSLDIHSNLADHSLKLICATPIPVAAEPIVHLVKIDQVNHDQYVLALVHT